MWLYLRPVLKDKDFYKKYFFKVREDLSYKQNQQKQSKNVWSPYTEVTGSKPCTKTIDVEPTPRSSLQNWLSPIATIAMSPLGLNWPAPDPTLGKNTYSITHPIAP